MNGCGKWVVGLLVCGEWLGLVERFCDVLFRAV